MSTHMSVNRQTGQQPGFSDRAARSWQQLAPRERNLVAGAAAIVVLALVWWIALAPALAVLRSAPVRHAEIDAQLQGMLKMQAEAVKLQSEPKIDPMRAQTALLNATRATLGEAAQVRVAGDRATVTIRNVPPDMLARWIAQARIDAHAGVVETHLTRNMAGPAGAAGLTGTSTNAGPGWDGSVVLGLPAR